jgi:MFS family permease
MNHAAAKSERIYDRPFVLAYVSNLFLMTAVSLLFRYADFVRIAGGTELNLGLIIGFGTIGAIVLRFAQGPAIDRFGPNGVWLASVAMMMIATLWHLRIDRVNDWEVYMARTLLATGTAGVFGAWMSFISLRVPQHRVAEAIGVVGSSGFAGMAIGPWLGDRIFSAGPVDWPLVHQMFWTATGLQLVAMLIAAAAGWSNRNQIRPPAEINAKFWTLVRQRHPWLLVAATICLGLNVSLPANFVRPFAHSVSVEEISWYFLTYNAVAFSFRLILRRAFQVIGLPNMIVLGIGAMIASFFLYLPVSGKYGLMVPAAVAGLGHAMLYPAVIASGTNLYPASLRGASTNLMLALYDTGVLVGSPLVGLLLAAARRAGWPEYPTMFICIAAVNLVVVVAFWAGQVRKAPATSSPAAGDQTIRTAR